MSESTFTIRVADNLEEAFTEIAPSPTEEEYSLSGASSQIGPEKQRTSRIHGTIPEGTGRSEGFTERQSAFLYRVERTYCRGVSGLTAAAAGKPLW